MKMTSVELERYRSLLSRSAEDARAYVIARLRDEGAGLDTAGMRELAIGVIEDATSVFGDRAQSTAADLFDEIMEVDGVDATAQLFDDLIDHGRTEGKVRYYARKLVDGDSAGFAADASDLAAYYVHRSAWENLVLNCDLNHVRWARVPTGRETCPYCLMLASRGFVYHTRDTASHGKHRGCDCVVVPGNKGSTVEGYDPEECGRLWQAYEEIDADETLSREEKKALKKAYRAGGYQKDAPPSFTVTRDAEVYRGITDAHVGDVERMLQDGDPNCMRLWSRFESKFKQPEFGKPTSQYDQVSGVVSFIGEENIFELSPKEYADTWFHEFGHNIDHLLASERWGYYSYEWRHGEFQAAIRSEAAAYVKSVDFASGVRAIMESGDRERIARFCRDSEALSTSDARMFLHGEISVDQVVARAKKSKKALQALVSDELRQLPDSEAHAVSDMFGGATGRKVKGKWGHDEEYWKKGGDKKRSTEAFAEMYAASVSSPESLAAIKRYFPRSYGLFQEMVREALQ